MVAKTSRKPQERSKGHSTKQASSKPAVRKAKKVKKQRKVAAKPKTISLRKVFSKQEKTKHLGTRPHSAWIYFCQDRRAEIVRNNPG